MVKSKTFLLALLLQPAANLSGAAAALSTYLVAGSVLQVRPDMVAVQRGKERWEIGRDSSSVRK